MIHFDGQSAIRAADLYRTGISAVMIVTCLLAVLNAPATAQPEGKIAYVRSRGGTAHIWSMNPDGSEKTQLTFGDGYGMSPSWSPDNRQIVFVHSPEFNAQAEHIATMDSDGQNVRILTATLGSYEDPAFSPDGSQILFAAQDELGWSLHLISASGGTQRRIPIEIDPQAPAHLSAPSWAPDGRFIAFVVWRDSDPSTDVGDIYRAAVDGRRVRRLTGPSGRHWYPAWSPDGEQIAIQSYHSPGAPHGIYLVGSEGGPGTHIFQPEGGGAGQPSWSPDGQWLTFMYNAHGQDIWVMRADGTELRQLTDGPASHSGPAWSTSGTPIARTAVSPFSWAAIKRLSMD